MKKKNRIFAVVLVLTMALALTGCNAGDYKNAVKSMESGDYAAAGATFKALADYKDSAAQAVECDYLLACEKLDEGTYDEAKELLQSINDYKDSAELISECNYLSATELLDGEKFEEAIKLFGSIEGYKDSAELLAQAQTSFLKERVTGVWICDGLDLSELVAAGIELVMEEEAEDFFEYCPIESFIVSMKMEFTENGNLYGGVDEASFDEAMGDYKENIKAGFGAYLMTAIEQGLAEEGATIADLEAALGETVTPEYFVQEIYGCTIDELVEEMFGITAIDPSAFVSSGTWEIEDGKIKIVDSRDTEYAEYDPEKDEITFTGEGLEDTEDFDYLYPLLFKRT